MQDIARNRDGLQLGELQQQLTEKEEVIAALTAQLEQAADELDRRHRTGLDRGLTIGGGGFPPELVEQQKAVTEELQAAVQRWEDMQVSLTLGRLEMQLTEIRDLITTPEPSGSTYRPTENAHPPKPSGGSSRPAQKEKNASDRNGAGSEWESIKSRYLDDQAGGTEHERPADDETSSVSAHESSDTPPPTEDDEPPTPKPSWTSGETVDVPMQEWDLEIPAPVEVETADIETLRSAVEARDKFIVEMTRRLRSLPVHMPPRDWEGLTSVPEELRQRLEEVLTRYDEKLRCAEIELSLERARLGRDEARLLELKESLEKQQKRLGANVPGHAPHDDGSDASGDPVGRSSLWRLLSKK